MTRRRRTSATLRVLMVAPTSFFADYGCHVRILEEARALMARGHAVRICAYHNGRDLPGLDIRRSVDVPWLKRAEVGSSRHKAYLDVALFVETLRQARAFRPDVIHGHIHEGALIGAVVGKLLRRPVVFDYQGSLTEEMLDHRFIRRGGLRERFFRRLERRIDGLPDVIVPSGAAGQRHLLARGVPAGRVRLVPDGVDTSWMRADDDGAARAAWRARLGIPPNAPVVVYLGLLAEYQGTTLLLDAARRLLACRPDAYVVIAGYPGADRYAQLARQMGLNGRVLFPGRVAYDDVPGLLSVGDVAVAPKLSSTESNGKVLNYMALGLPVVAFDNPVNRAILGGLGRLVPAGDADALADALLDSFDDSPAAREALRRRVGACFSWTERVLELEAAYAQALGRERVNAPVERAPTGD